MFEHSENVIERIVAHLRRPVRIDPAVDSRVMEEIAGGPTPRVSGGASAAWHWLTVLILPGRRPHEAPPAETATRAFQFVVVAPRAARVALVGDFNDWDAARTPMRPSQRGGPVWTAVVPLSPGRYRYAFLVDGSRWLADPAAPAARDDEFGTPSSVVTVGGS
ncbi:MAG: hypothetical protein AUH12_00255 [Gemmatimonadetes bacterium 13_2_20CM_69_8]|nr:MAG: hypothetical protein AUH12_00255 [Gemmatimonadetes bacterium 13_2_20CM_69_8]